MANQLLNHINTRVAFQESAFREIVQHFETVNFPKKHQLIGADDAISHQYFVLKGCLRTYLIDAQGKEHTIQFAVEDWWVSDYIAYYKKVPSIFKVECLEDCLLLKISKSTLTALFDPYPMLERYFRLQLENAFVAFQQRILSSLNLTAEERYDAFIKTYPAIEQRVKNYQIASYLGVTPESLSRIRKQRLQSS